MGRRIENKRGLPKLYETSSERYPWKVVFRKAGIQEYFRPGEKAAAEARHRELMALVPEVGVAGLAIDSRLRAEVAASIEVLEPFEGVSILDACRDYAKRNGIADAGLTLVDARDLFLRAKLRERVSKRTYSTLESRINALIAFSKVLRVSELTREIVLAWLESKGGSARTFVNDFAAASNWLGWLVAAKRLGENPCDGIALPRVDAEPPRSLGVEEIWALMVQAMAYRDPYGVNPPGFMAPYFALGIFAGLRPGEIERLELGDVLLNRIKPLIQVRRGKMRSRVTRVVPIEPGLKSFLEAFPVASFYPRRCFRRSFDRIREAAGLKANWQGDIMRHTYASYMLEVYDIKSVGKWMGDNVATVERYYIEPRWPGEGRDFLDTSIQKILG